MELAWEVTEAADLDRQKSGEYGTMVAREFADWGYRSHVQAFIH